jgi:TRAP-type C4-dicarboxylate transport system substrate-binding protein
VVMGFGEVPSALESGVLDGLMTSIGGWLSVRQQAPFYTTGGAGVFTGDYYMVSSSRRWWDRLPKATQEALEKLIAETIQVQKELNWCVDKMTYEKYGTKDPSKPGVYWMTPQEVSQLTAALGNGPDNWKKTKMPPQAQQLVDSFKKEGQELSRQNPPGSSWIEKVDCSKHASKIVIR